MRSFKIVSIILATLGLAAPAALADEKMVLESRFFRSTLAEGAALPGPAVIVTSFSDPVFLPAPPASFAADADLTVISAMKAELSGVYRLKQVDYLYSGRLPWNGKRAKLKEEIVLDGMLYRIFYYPVLAEGSNLSLRVAVWRHSGIRLLKEFRDVYSKDASGQHMLVRSEADDIKSVWGDGDIILNTEIAARLDDPVVFGFPVNGHAFFLSIHIKKDDSEEDRNPKIKVAPLEGAEEFPIAYVPPKPKNRVTPPYPEACLQKGIEGLVILLVRTDETGKVKSVHLWQKANPELEKSSLEALRQWTFEPLISKDKAVPASFFMSVDFRLPFAAPAAAGPDNRKEKPPEK